MHNLNVKLFPTYAQENFQRQSSSIFIPVKNEHVKHKDENKSKNYIISSPKMSRTQKSWLRLHGIKLEFY